MQAVERPTHERERIARAEHKGSDLLQVRTVIADSWARCASRGMPTDALDVPRADEFDRESMLYRSAQPVLAALAAAVANEPISILLSDASGAVVARECSDRTILAALDRVALAPGSVYSEQAVGTNGFGLALADNRTSLVSGPEHYSMALTGYTCAGAPIHDPVSGSTVGALSLTTWSDQRTDLLLALADQTAMNIETQLAVAGSRDSGRLVDCIHAIAARQSVRRPAAPRLRLSRIEEIELDAIVAALERHRGVVAEAAADLGISRATMYRKVKRYRIRLRTAGDS